MLLPECNPASAVSIKCVPIQPTIQAKSSSRYSEEKEMASHRLGEKICRTYPDEEFSVQYKELL